MGYEARLRGVLDYDIRKRAFTRFDIVVLGDLYGDTDPNNWLVRPGRNPWGLLSSWCGGVEPRRSTAAARLPDEEGSREVPGHAKDGADSLDPPEATAMGMSAARGDRLLSFLECDRTSPGRSWPIRRRTLPVGNRPPAPTAPGSTSPSGRASSSTAARRPPTPTRAGSSIRTRKEWTLLWPHDALTRDEADKPWRVLLPRDIVWSLDRPGPARMHGVVYDSHDEASRLLRRPSVGRSFAATGAAIRG